MVSKRNPFNLVSLFVRHSERIYEIVVGEVIEGMCSSYFGESEYFSKEHKGKRCKLEKDDRTCSLRRNGGSTIYGNIWVNDAMKANIYKWTFKIKEKKLNMFIGIDSNPKFTECDFSNFHRGLGMSPNDIFCAYGSDGSLYGYFSPMADEYGIAWSSEDIIEMIVNPEAQTLSYCVNGMDQGIALDDLRFDTHSYRMAVALFFESDCIELADFYIDCKQSIKRSDDEGSISDDDDAEILIERFAVKQIGCEWKQKWVIVKGCCLWIEHQFDELYEDSSLIIKNIAIDSKSDTQFIVTAEDRMTNEIKRYLINATSNQIRTEWMNSLH